MTRKLWQPIVGVKIGDEHHCGNCWNSLSRKNDERATSCTAEAKVIKNGDGTVTVISPCSGVETVWPEAVIEGGQ